MDQYRLEQIKMKLSTFPNFPKTLPIFHPSSFKMSFVTFLFIVSFFLSNGSSTMTLALSLSICFRNCVNKGGGGGFLNQEDVERMRYF